MTELGILKSFSVSDLVSYPDALRKGLWLQEGAAYNLLLSETNLCEAPRKEVTVLQIDRATIGILLKKSSRAKSSLELPKSFRGGLGLVV
jgi:hypothetical protein